MNENGLEIIKKSFNENRNSHAFLVETNSLELCLSDIKKLIFEINNISREIILENIPDIKVIYPYGKDIKREQISSIIEEFQTFPVELKHRYYIVVSSELMNQSAANVILKFLEEPDNAVVGFFITLNKSAMIDTIVSRCQHYKLNYEEKEKVEEELVIDFVDKMNSKEVYKKILFLNSFIGKDRVDNINKIKEIKNYLLDSDIVQENVKLLVKRVGLLDNVIEKLTKNANQELVILDLARNWK